MRETKCWAAAVSLFSTGFGKQRMLQTQNQLLRSVLCWLMHEHYNSIYLIYCNWSPLLCLNIYKKICKAWTGHKSSKYWKLKNHNNLILRKVSWECNQLLSKLMNDKMPSKLPNIPNVILKILKTDIPGINEPRQFVESSCHVWRLIERRNKERDTANVLKAWKHIWKSSLNSRSTYWLFL